MRGGVGPNSGGHTGGFLENNTPAPSPLLLAPVLIWAAAPPSPVALPPLTPPTHLQLHLPLMALPAADGRKVESGVGGVQRPSGRQEPVPRQQHAIQHALPQQEIPLQVGSRGGGHACTHC